MKTKEQLREEIAEQKRILKASDVDHNESDHAWQTYMAANEKLVAAEAELNDMPKEPDDTQKINE